MFDSDRDFQRVPSWSAPRRKILIYGINFAPEAVGVGRFTGEMAEYLHAAGNDVRVVTALPYYPEWKVSPGYSPWRYSTETWRGIPVSRAPLWVPQKPRGRSRVVHLLSFAIASLPLLVRGLLWRPDVIWMAAPSLACAPGALAAAKLCGARTWLHVQDFEIDIGFGMGMITGGRWKRLALFLERSILGRFDRMSTISKAMMARATSKGFDPGRLVLIPNWADLAPVSLGGAGASYRAELGIPADATVALYSGSMGVKQGVDIAAEAALLLQDVPGLYFVFCGNGALRGEVEKLAAGSDRIRLLPFQPESRFPALLDAADIHLLPQRPITNDLVMPSKLTSMLASAKPVVMLADEASELAEVGHQCGIVVPHGNVQAFADGIRRLAADPAVRAELGQRGRLYAESHLSSTVILRRYLDEMEGLLESDDGHPGHPRRAPSKDAHGAESLFDLDDVPRAS